MKISDFCAEVKNWFDIKRVFGKFTIKNGVLIVDDMLNGQYFRIAGSVFNNGVYQYPVNNLKDETFDGALWYMAIPPDVLQLITEMTAWETQYADILNSPYNSESYFGEYSYTLAGGLNGTESPTSVVFSRFSKQMDVYRKVRNV